MQLNLDRCLSPTVYLKFAVIRRFGSHTAAMRAWNARWVNFRNHEGLDLIAERQKLVDCSSSARNQLTECINN